MQAVKCFLMPHVVRAEIKYAAPTVSSDVNRHCGAHTQ